MKKTNSSMDARDILTLLDKEESNSLKSECHDLFEPTEEFYVGEEPEEVLQKSKVFACLASCV